MTHPNQTVRTPFWRRAPRLASFAAILWFFALMVAFSDAGVAWPLWMAFFISGIGLAGWWLLRLVVVLAAERSQQTLHFRKMSVFWISVPLCIALGVGLIAFSVPLVARLYFSADALVASAPALAVVPDLELFQQSRRVGLFRVREFSQFGRELRFKTSECGLVDACGVIYSPDKPPPNRGEDSFHHLYGPWWHWYQSW